MGRADLADVAIGMDVHSPPAGVASRTHRRSVFRRDALSARFELLRRRPCAGRDPVLGPFRLFVHRCAAHSWSKSKAFTRLRRASYFSLLAQRKSNQKKEHPKAAVSGLLSCDFAAGLRGFADSTSVCWQRTGRDPSRPPCGPFLRPAATAYGARVARILRARAKSKRDSQSQSPSSACGTFSRKAGEGRSGAAAAAQLHACGDLLGLGCAGCAVNGAPMQWRSGGEKARRVAR
ncbi:hypothetical protein SAMN05216289_1381, partial [Dokdonella immobilis]